MVVVALSVLPGVAWAGDDAPVDRRRARKLYREGVKAARLKEYQKAVRLLKDAHRYWASPRIQRNLALVYVEMNRPLAAYRHLRLFLEKASASERKRLPEPLKKLRQQVGTIVVQAVKPGVTLWLDGRRVGDGPREIEVLAGAHVVELRQGSRVVTRSELTVRGGTVVRWAPRIRPRPVEPRLRPGPEKKQGTKGRARLHWGYFAAVAGLALVSGAALAGVGTKTLQVESDYDRAPTEDLRTRGILYKRAANALLGVTAATAAAAVILAVLTRWKSKERSPTVWVAPAVGPRGATLLLSGEF